MLSTEQIRAHLARCSYKAGWAFEAYDGAHEGQHLRITVEVENTYRPGETVTLDVHSSLPPIPTAGYLSDWLLWRLKRLEIHEAMEFFKVDGMPHVDPHRPRADRDEPAYGTTEAATGAASEAA